MKKKVQYIFFDSSKTTFELVALNTRFYWEEYLSSGVSMLTKSLKILYTAKTEFLELISFQNDQKIWPKYCRAVLRIGSDPFLTCWLSISALIRGFRNILVTVPLLPIV